MCELFSADGSNELQLVSGTIYEGLAKKLIYHLKYDNDRLIAHDLGLVLSRAFQRLPGHELMTSLIVPVPLHWRRLAHRRFNQAELLSRQMLTHLQSAGNDTGQSFRRMRLCRELLCRTRHTAAQNRLPREERLHNVRGAFTVNRLWGNGELTDCRIVLVDDIYTSGATMAEAARTLFNAGAQKVCGVSVSRAILNKDL